MQQGAPRVAAQGGFRVGRRAALERHSNDGPADAADHPESEGDISRVFWPHLQAHLSQRPRL